MNSTLLPRTLCLGVTLFQLTSTISLASPPASAAPHRAGPAGSHSAPSGAGHGAAPSFGNHAAPLHGGSSGGYRPTPYHPSHFGPDDHSTNYRPTDSRSSTQRGQFQQTSTKYHSDYSGHSASGHDATISSHAVAGVRNGRISDHRFYSEVRSYHDLHSTVVLNRVYALHPRYYHGHWAGGWYHGYWYGFWAGMPWAWYQGNYGFWLTVAAASVFVAETSPGVCSYWNGYAWVPYWNPPYTPYYCPY
jgi:hypothetical protein